MLNLNSSVYKPIVFLKSSTQITPKFGIPGPLPFVEERYEEQKLGFWEKLEALLFDKIRPLKESKENDVEFSYFDTKTSNENDDSTTIAAAAAVVTMISGL